MRGSSMLLIAALLSVACDGAARQSEHPVARDNLISLSGSSGVCQATGGQWHHLLQSCRCPDAMTFGARTGCRLHPIVGADRQEHSDQSKRGWTVRVGDTRFTGAGVTEDTLPDAVRGYTIAGAEPEPIGFYLVAKRGWSREDIEQELDHRPVKPTVMFMSQTNLDAEGVRSEPGQKCALLLSQMWPDRFGDSLSLCAALDDFTKRIATDDAVGFFPRTQHAGADLEVVQYLVHPLEYPRVAGRYSLIGKNDTYWVRTVDLAAGDDLRIEILMSPTGAIAGGRARRFVALDPTEQGLISTNDIFFGAGFQPVESDTHEYGGRANIARAIKAVRKQRTDGAALRLPTDGWGLPFAGEIRIGLVEENGLNVAHVGLLSRFDIQVAAADAILEGKRLMQPLLGPPGSEIRHYLDLARGDHGLAVASRLLADLPYAKGILLPLVDGYQTFTRVGRDRFLEGIRASTPKVVNISLTTRNEMPNCDEWFGYVFDALKDDVLFVVAAGNDGSDHPSDVCPASIGYKHENVVTVAGSEGQTIHAWSNRGSPWVKVAAPMCAPTIVSREGDEPNFTLSTQCGTSFASAIVANMAAKVRGLCPWLKPKQVIAMLAAFCDNEGLDVGCGGSINQPEIERFLRLACQEDEG